MTHTLPLSGWTLVSMRPQNQHAPVRRAAQKWGARVISASVIKLVPSHEPAALAEVMKCPVRIATSPNAVRFAAKHQTLSGDWLAVGTSTAKALLSVGARSVQTPEPQTAEGVLALAGLQSIKGKQIGLLTAPDGRGLLEKELAARGAQLIIAHTYQRQTLPLKVSTCQQIIDSGPRTALLITSQQAFRHFFAQFDDAGQRTLKTQICVASSVRLLEYIQTLGFERVLTSQGTKPKDVIQTLASALVRDQS
jgi:uroporphyrinogen-III synthase